MKFYIVSFFTAALACTPVYLLLRRPWKRREIREIFLFLYTVYCLALLWLVLRGSYASPAEMLRSAQSRVTETHMNINLVPFKTMRLMLGTHMPDQICINIIANFVLFVPCSFGMLALWKRTRNVPCCLAVCLGVPLLIEFLQLFINRNTDIDDVILNFAGGLCGVILFIIVHKVFPRIDDIAK
jgi:glycopeptide antibiotics resistance protein